MSILAVPKRTSQRCGDGGQLWAASGAIGSASPDDRRGRGARGPSWRLVQIVPTKNVPSGIGSQPLPAGQPAHPTNPPKPSAQQPGTSTPSSHGGWPVSRTRWAAGCACPRTGTRPPPPGPGQRSVRPRVGRQGRRRSAAGSTPATPQRRLTRPRRPL